MIDEKTQQWLSKMYGIPENEIVWYNSGICYSRIGVKTEESALKVREKVKGRTANGGWFDGMPLGSYSQTKEGNYDVTC